MSVPGSATSGRWRYLDDGKIEVEGVGIPSLAEAACGKGGWCPAVNGWTTQIRTYAARYGLPEAFVAGIMQIESGGNPKAGSWAGAKGLMQLMASTATARAKAVGMPVPLLGIDRSDPEVNIELGTAELRAQVDRHHDFVLAAIGYNAGDVHLCPKDCSSWCYDPNGKQPFPKCKQQSDCAAGTCTERSYWGVRTDGSAYPLLAIKAYNSALDHGFPLSGAMPDLANLPPVVLPKRPVVDTLTPFSAILLTAAAAFGGYWLTKRSARPRRRRRSRK